MTVGIMIIPLAIGVMMLLMRFGRAWFQLYSATQIQIIISKSNV